MTQLKLIVFATAVCSLTATPEVRATRSCTQCAATFAKRVVGLADAGYRVGSIDVIDRRLALAGSPLTFRLLMVRGASSTAVELDFDPMGHRVLRGRELRGVAPLADKIYPNAPQLVAFLRARPPTALEYSGTGYMLAAGARRVAADPADFHVVERVVAGAAAPSALRAWLADALGQGLDLVEVHATRSRARIVFSGRTDRTAVVRLDGQRRVVGLELWASHNVVPRAILTDSARARLSAWLAERPAITQIRATRAGTELVAATRLRIRRADFAAPVSCGC